MLTASEFIQAQNQILSQLKKHQESFIGIEGSNEPLITKWQQFLNILLPIQKEVIAQFGFSDHQAGATNFLLKDDWQAVH